MSEVFSVEMDVLKRTIQDFFQDQTVTIVGSGLSLAEGIPGMGKLASHLNSRMPSLITSPEDDARWKAISHELDSGAGLEMALQKVKPTPTLEELIRTETANLIGSADIELLRRIINSQHQLRFAEYLSHFNIRNNGLTVITTNYDRLIEYACEANDVRVDTLFVGRHIAKFKPEQSKFSFFESMSKRGGKVSVTPCPKVTLYKPHGCLSWRYMGDDVCSVYTEQFGGCLIITPGLNKYQKGYSIPFDTHRIKANEAIDSAARFVIIGYGFNDDHLETHLRKQLTNGKPALILSMGLSENARQIVKESSNTIAICKSGTSDSLVIINDNEQVFSNINLWDIREMIKEVF